MCHRCTTNTMSYGCGADNYTIQWWNNVTSRIQIILFPLSISRSMIYCIIIYIIVYFQYSVKYFLQNATNRTTNNNCLTVITIIILEYTAPSILALSVLAGAWIVVFRWQRCGRFRSLMRWQVLHWFGWGWWCCDRRAPSGHQPI